MPFGYRSWADLGKVLAHNEKGARHDSAPLLPVD